MTVTEEEANQFRREGYFVRQGFVAPDRVAEITADVDRWAAKEARFDGTNLADYDVLSSLPIDPAVLAVADALMGASDYVFHHLHAARHDPGLPGVVWHHDYEQIPQTNRSHLQLHVLHYLEGLDGKVGDLLVLPRSHRAVMRRDAMALFGEADLPGMVVLDDLPPGSTVFMHSALVHARRAKPGGGRPRYFIDIAYMQRGVAWPSYGREGWRGMLARMDRRRHQSDRPGLFDAGAFFDIADGVARVKGLEGSLALKLPEAAVEARPTSGAIPIVQ